ncbi:MAG: hypothetical protein U0228_21145 [Myxococcaceae bacterium]
MRSRLVLVSALVTLAACGSPTGMPDAGGCTDSGKTPPNLLENPGFECDTSPATWSAIFGKLDFVSGGRSGRAAQVTVDATGGRFTYAKEFAPNPGTKSYCFTAWKAGTAPFIRMRVLRDFNGSVQEVAFSDQNFSDFRKIPTQKVTADNAPKLLLVFEVQTNRTDGMNAMPGQTMLIDDVDVWETTSNCNER